VIIEQRIAVDAPRGPVDVVVEARGFSRAVQHAAPEQAGGSPPQDPLLEKGNYLTPTIFDQVKSGMRIAQEEIFGPVLVVFPFKTDEEAVQIANDSRYGLTASIWTADAQAAIRIGDRVETGTWFMNRCDYLDPALAWTGVKDSGRGCTLSRLGLESFTRPKSFHLRLTL